MRIGLALCVLTALSACGDADEATRNQVRLSVVGPGTVHVLPDDFACEGQCRFARDEGTALFLTAIPARGAAVQAWSGPCAGAERRCTIRPSSPAQVEVRFEALCPEPWTLASGPVAAMDVHDSGWLVTAGASVQVFDTLRCERIWTHELANEAVAFDVYGNVLAATDTGARLLAGPNGFPLWEVDLGATVHAVAVDEDNRFALAGHRDGSAWLVGLDALDGATRWERSPGPGTLLALEADGEVVWTAGVWMEQAFVAGYRTENRLDLWQSPVTGTQAVAVTSVGDQIAALVDRDTRTLVRFDRGTGEVVSEVSAAADALKSGLASGDELVDLASGTILGGPATRSAIATDRSYVYVASGSSVVRIPRP